jgi:hypothetical protein
MLGLDRTAQLEALVLLVTNMWLREETTRRLAISYNEKFYNINLPPDILKVMKSWRISWDGYVSGTEEKIHTGIWWKNLKERIRGKIWCWMRGYHWNRMKCCGADLFRWVGCEDITEMEWSVVERICFAELDVRISLKWNEVLWSGFASLSVWYL